MTKLVSKAAAQLIEGLTASRNIIDAKKKALVETQELVVKAVGEARSIALAVVAQLATTHRDECILIIDYRGNVLHANQVAHKVLGCEPYQIIGRPLDEVLDCAPDATSVYDCSVKLHRDVLEAARTHGIVIGNVIVNLDAAASIAFKGARLCIKLSLLDTTPASLEDVTYICKLLKE